MKRECAAFIPSPDDESSCQCGRRKLEHDEEILAHPPKIHRSEEWTPSRHTVAVPTDAYGQIIFEGEHHPNKSRVIWFKIVFMAEGIQCRDFMNTAVCAFELRHESRHSAAVNDTCVGYGDA